ncbi:hypothetical protein MVEN_01709500 [Mycena venus]|uniref:Uncharacterized protein n=1 Tax=Mycena venus TaxID=2733690 RepID=A0A8H6XPG0_9AGAR|nr:hypothetical protein MVEN_01709500 [Mycena venus]
MGHSLNTINSTLNPVYFHGDILVLNSRLRGRKRPSSGPMTLWPTSLNRWSCTPSRESSSFAHALTLSPNPTPTPDPPVVRAPLVVHCFGWVYGVALATISRPNTQDSSNSFDFGS